MLLGYYTTMIPLMCIGTVWPAYQSYKAVASKDADTMARWLQYWLVFAVLTLAGPTIDAIGAFVPLFYELKIGFTLWLIADSLPMVGGMGATKIFEKLSPHIDAQLPMVDAKVELVMSKAKNIKADDLRALAEWVQKNGGPALEGLKAKATAASEQADKPEEPVDVSEEVEKKDK